MILKNVLEIVLSFRRITHYIIILKCHKSMANLFSVLGSIWEA